MKEKEVNLQNFNSTKTWKSTVLLTTTYKKESSKPTTELLEKLKKISSTKTPVMAESPSVKSKLSQYQLAPPIKQSNRSRASNFN